jgi:hypothetical protein
MDEQKIKVLEIISNEAAGFYKLVITIAGGFLGGSLIFMEKIVSSPTVCSLIFLGLGWLLLIGSISVVGYVRRLNLKSGKLTLDGKSKEAQKIDDNSDKYTSVSIFLLGGGLFFIMVFGFINIVNKYT